MMTKRLVSVLAAASMLLTMASTSAQGVTPPAVGTQAPAVTPKNTAPGAVREIDWDELLPPDARARFTAAPPAAVHDYLGEGGMAAQQVMDFSINKALEGANIKIPGFIVPLDVGKSKRLATVHQRRALAAVHPTCAFPNCTVKFAHCEPHHLTPWEHGGPTDLHNLVPLCSRHHHAVHEGGVTISLDEPTRQVWVTSYDP